LRDLPLRIEGTAVPTFAALAHTGSVWIAVRDQLPSGQEIGLGVLELSLPSGKVVHHRAYGAGEARAPEALTIPGDVRSMVFQAAAGSPPAQAMWFCTSSGVLRFSQGELTRWGEDDGLENERCADLTVAADGTAWLASPAGPARFDGKGWRPALVGWPSGRGSEEGEPLGVRALADCGAGPVAATPRGLWRLAGSGSGSGSGSRSGGGAAGRAGPAESPRRWAIGPAGGPVDDDMVDLACDRYGRLWSLGHLGVTLSAAERP
jgi:hypothetical protein